MTAKQIGAWVAVAVVVLVITLGLLVSFGIINPEDSEEGISAVSTVTAGLETVIPLVETANAVE